MSITHIPLVDPKLGQAATPAAFIKAITLAYKRYNVDPANALNLAQISPELLDEPNARVTAAQMEIMSAAAMQELDDEALGWFSRKLPWGSYGMLCRASLTAPNLGIALRRWCRHHRLLTDDIIPHLTQDASVATITFEQNRLLGDVQELCLVTCLRYVHGYACWIIDSRIPLIETHFPFAPPVHHNAYPLMFRGPVQFDAAEAKFSFDVRYLNLPLHRDECDLQQMLLRALPLTVLQYRRDRLLVQKVRQLLKDQTDQSCTAESLADQLHVSIRTLHRQLREEGASLQYMKDEARRGKSVDLLTRTKRPIKQVALEVGFRCQKSFARAFKQWTGKTPKEYRAS
jgi:AraC-like DNA-binding protein